MPPRRPSLTTQPEKHNYELATEASDRQSERRPAARRNPILGQRTAFTQWAHAPLNRHHELRIKRRSISADCGRRSRAIGWQNTTSTTTSAEHATRSVDHSTAKCHLVGKTRHWNRCILQFVRAEQ
jgi:hypothetical protein